MQHLESLRHQIHDAEDQATKISVEEQTQTTIIHALENDLSSAKSLSRQIVDDADQMLKKTVDIRSQIFDKGKLVSALESDYVSLAQTVDLIQQERISVSARLLEKRLYYLKLSEEMNSELIRNQTMNATDTGRKAEERSSGEDHSNNSKEVSKQKPSRDLNSEKSELEKITNAKQNLLSENNKIQQSIEQVKCQVNEIKLETKGIDMMSLEDESKALSSDKNGEKEYLQTLQLQIERLKGISQVTRCDCGQEYKVDGSPTCL